MISSCRSGLHSARRHRGDEAHVFGLASERDAQPPKTVELRGDVLRGERRRGNPGVEQRILMHPRPGEHHRHAHPFFWAPFILVGAPAGPPSTR